MLLGALQATARSFWDFNIGNVVVLVGMLGGFFGWLLSKNSDAAILRQRVEMLEKWQDAHEKEAGKRDELIQELDNCIVRLTTLAETAQSRLVELERRRSHGD